MIHQIQEKLQEASSLKRKKANEWFFKTGKGQYGEYDQFIGVSMPDIRKIANDYKFLKRDIIKRLLYSKIHEERMLSVIILINQYKTSINQKEIYNFYLKHINQVNNWDLVDVSSYKIIGSYIHRTKLKHIKTLINLSKSNSIWERRISIISTFFFIKKGIFQPTFTISKKLLLDKEDLIQKAIGWMLREIWKKNNKITEDFILQNYHKISRTTLRYSIEKMEENQRKKFLKGVF